MGMGCAAVIVAVIPNPLKTHDNDSVTAMTAICRYLKNGRIEG
jgi:hypothetical protein